MMTSKLKAQKDYSVRTATSVQQFLDDLLPGASHWNSAKRGDLAYRGQASSRWRLVPKAFRKNQIVGYESDASPGALIRVAPQALAEFRAVQQFLKAADTSGLQIVEAAGRLLLQEDPRHIFNDIDWAYRWPQDEVLEILALAQHHGIPTRLLDFTEDPLVGAYFAANYGWDQRKGERIKGRDRSYLAVWVIDLRFVRAINGIVSRYPERIGEIRVPRANNAYLHAQFAFFLVDRGANDVITRGELLSIDRVIAERARFWHNGNRLAWKEVKQTWFDELPVRQVRIHSRHTRDLLKELENRGITRGSVMPSLDRVVESLEVHRSIQ